jgi:hypothetical protein
MNLFVICCKLVAFVINFHEVSTNCHNLVTDKSVREQECGSSVLKHYESLLSTNGLLGCYSEWP